MQLEQRGATLSLTACSGLSILMGFEIDAERSENTCISY
jgi:hypothetical protein